ncbi:MAG: hypothetical protein ABI317_02850 [Gaiellales bacterium]
MTSRAGELFEAASVAASVLPVVWQRDGSILRGLLDGQHGSYDVTIATHRAHVFVVRVVSQAPIPEQAAERVALLCMDATWTMPTAGFFYSPGSGGAVVSAATLTFNHSDEVAHPTILRNTIRECMLNAELFARVQQAVVEGSSIEEAREFRRRLFPALAAGELGGMPGYLAQAGPPPADDGQLIDACEAAARKRGWQLQRRSRDQLVVQGETFVDVHAGCLVVSSYPGVEVRPDRRGAVADLLNRLLDAGSPFTLALDLELGAVVARSFLDVRGLAQIPPAALLCDVIFQAGGGARVHLDEIERVANERRAADRPFGSSGSTLRDRLQAARRDAA